MTVSTTSSRISYTPNGSTTVFAYPYKFLATTDIVVYLNGVLQTSGYSVGTPTDAGANITFATPPVGSNLVIFSEPDHYQATSLPGTGPFPSASVERMSDKLTLLMQRLFDKCSRALNLSDGDTTTSMTLPLAATRANGVLGFDSLGNIQVIPPTAGSTTVNATLVTPTIINPTITSSSAQYSVSVNSISALRSLTVPANNTAVNVTGYYAAADGGGGVFIYVSGASVGTYVDNGGTIITPTGGNGSAAYLRVVPTGPINVRWFGAKGDGSTNDRTALLAANTYASSLNTSNYFPYGTYVTSLGLPLTQDCIFDLGASISILSGTVIFYGTIFAPKNIPIFKGAGTFQLPNHRDVVTAEWWGAVADGSTLCASAINAAQTALTNGGTIQFLNGIYIIDAAVTISNRVDLIGAGWGLNASGEGTIFKPSSSFGASSSNTMFTINCGSTRTQNFQIQGISGTSTFNAMATGSNAGLNNFERIDINGCGSGLNIPQGNGMTFRNCRIQGFSVNGIYLGGTSGQYPGDISWQEIVVIANTGATCILIDGMTNAQYFHRVELISGYQCLFIRGTGGTQRPGGLFFFDCNFTNASSYNVNINKAWQVFFYNTWIGGCTAGPGVLINASSTTQSDIDGVCFENCVVGGNYLHGINYQCGTNVVLEGCQIIGNSQAGSGTYNGVYVQATTYGAFQMTGCVATQTLWNTSGPQGYGVYLTTGSVATGGGYTGRINISGNILGGNVTGAISDGSSPAGAFKVITNNVTS